MNEEILAVLQAELAELRAKVNRLEKQADPAAPAPSGIGNPPVSTRRRALKKLAAGMLGAGAAVLVTAPTQARVVVPGGGAAPAIGAIVVRSGVSTGGTPGTGAAFGLVASSQDPGGGLDLGSLPAVKAGVYGRSDSGLGVLAESNSGAPLGIVPGALPATGSSGQFYVDKITGNLFFYRGSWQPLFPAVADFVERPAGAGTFAVVAAGVFRPNPDLSSPTNPIFVPEGTANYNGLVCLTSFAEFAINEAEFRFKFNGYENLTGNAFSKYVIKALPYYLGGYPPTTVNSQLIVNFGRFTTNDFSLVFGTPGFMVSNNQTPYMRFMVEVSRFTLPS